MRMFGYYAFHSFINQIRKLFHTWVLVLILACGLLGGLIGFGAAVLFDDEPEYTAVPDVPGQYVDGDGDLYYRYTDPEGEIFYLAEDLVSAWVIAETDAFVPDPIEGVVRDEAGAAYIVCEDDLQQLQAIPYALYADYNESYDHKLSYIKEYNLFCSEYPDYDPEYTVMDNPEEAVPEPGEWGFGDGTFCIGRADGTVAVYSKAQMVEAGALLLSLVMVFFFAFRADQSGGKIFPMGDVNFLFSSPLKPQSILLFRLLTQLSGVLAVMLVYAVIYTPTIGELLGGGFMTVLSFFLMIFFLMGGAMLAQVLIYTEAASHPGLGKKIRIGLYAGVAALLGIYILSWKSSGLEPLDAGLALLTSKPLRLVPFFGWVKAAAGCVAEHNVGQSLLWMGLLMAGMGALTYVIWGIKADFYEDAMTKSEEVAQMMQKMQESSSLFGKMKKKETEDKPKKPSRAERNADGIRHGLGASTLFYKQMHVRYRFSALHYFTKTCNTYLLTALFFCAFGKLVNGTDLYLPAVLSIGSMCFFRALSNPMEEDLKTDVFRMFPEPAGVKIFWSLAGGTANCVLDVLPALVLLTIVFWKNPVTTLGWFIVVLSVYLYSTTVGAFMAVSIPEHVGATVKQIIQVMFVYFGLLPDIVLIAFGLMRDAVVPFAAAACAVNLALSFLFVLLSADYIEPKEGSMAIKAEGTAAAKTVFSGIGWALVILYAAGSVAQIAATIGLLAVDQVQVAGSVAQYAATFLPLYLVGFPLGIWLIRRLPKAEEKPGKETFTWKRLLTCFVIGAGLAYTFSMLAQLLGDLLSGLFGGSGGSAEALESLITQDSMIMQVIFLCILAPIFEELVFRKLIIDHTRSFGEKKAVIYSAMLFGLFHGNLAQFLYAAAFGLVLGYVYLRNGKIRNTIVMHMLFNLNGSILAGSIERLADTPVNQMIAGTYNLVIYGVILAAFVLLFRKRKDIYFEEPKQQASWKQIWINSGMMAFLLLMLAMIGISIIA